MQLTNVIIRPYLTEKSYTKRAEECKKYAFIVDMNATKADIAMAFASMFEIDPIAVRTMVRKSVATRTGTAHPGYTKAFKIAYITLPKGKDIAVSKEEFEAQAKDAPKADKPAAKVKEVAKELKKPDAKEVAKPQAEVDTAKKTA